MSKTLLKGETNKVSVQFGSAVTLVQSPTWTLLDWDGDVLLSGTASADGNNAFSATITIPMNLIIPDGEQDLDITFAGVDAAGATHERTREITVVDMYDDWKSYGLLWYPGAAALEDTAMYERQPTSLTISLREGYGAGVELGSAIVTDPVPLSTTTRGYVYRLTLPMAAPERSASGGWYPYQLFVTAKFANALDDVMVKPVYVLSPQSISFINSLKRYLDKARIDELDPNLSWPDEELMHFILEGAKHINGIGEVTYYTPDTMPSSLHSQLNYASAMLALNARYLAEGMNNFDFSGANSTLSIDRRDTLATKIDELNNILNTTLETAKKRAIGVFGVGTPPPGVIAGQKAIGRLGIALGPNTNVTTRAPWRGWRRFGNY